MGDYQRTTRECAVAALRPELARAIREHAQKHDLGDVEADVLLCCETTSERKKPGWLGKLMGDSDKVLYTGVVVTPRWLIWATSSAKGGPAVLSARLRDIEVKDYEVTPAYKLVEDTGLEVFGLMTGAAERASTFIGLGREPAAHKVRSVLREAVQRASAPR